MKNIIEQIDDYIGRNNITRKVLFSEAGLDISNYFRWRGYYNGNTANWSYSPNMRNVQKLLDVINKETANV